MHFIVFCETVPSFSLLMWADGIFKSFCSYTEEIQDSFLHIIFVYA